jgi:exopolyphosphatase / guanosine-5'-triphosphate,3'-diphosphate pyrophosphatase
MITARVHLLHTSCRVEAEGVAHEFAIGSRSLSAGIGGDPPQPEELTNAIGLVLDHLEDVSREVPAFELADRVELTGPDVSVLADVEVGGAAALPFELTRAAAEDVFRTLVTEAASARRHNPGLPEPLVHHVLGVACATVAVLRFLSAPAVWVVAA